MTVKREGLDSLSSANPRRWEHWLNRLVHQATLLFPFLGVYALAAGWPSRNLAVQVVLVIWTAYFLFCWTSTFHETAHQTLPLPKWFNLALGRMIGTVLLAPYTVYRESHIRHHAYLNRPNDWELWPYSDPKCSLTFRRVFVWIDLLLGFVTSPCVYGRIYFSRHSPIRQPRVRRAILAEYIVILLFWGTVLVWVTRSGYWSAFLLAWVLPHWAAGVLQSGRKFTEHLGMDSFDPLQGTRTVLGENWITKLSSFFNFEIFVHGPHHRFPRVEHQHLKARMNELMAQTSSPPYPVYSTYFAAARAMLPSLIFSPGVGLNAGAASVNRISREDVTEFLEDAEEVTTGGWS